MNYLVSGCLYLIVGSISIGVGGLLTTRGWSQLNNHSQRKALIQGAANEWLTNEFSLPCKNLPFDPNKKELGEIHYLYPTFRSSALNIVLTSSLFTLENTGDRKLLLQIMRYEEHISNFNYLLRKIDDECIRTGVNQEQRISKYRGVNESPLFQNYYDSHRAMGQLIEDNYGWALSERIGKRFEQLRERRHLPVEKTTNGK